MRDALASLTGKRPPHGDPPTGGERTYNKGFIARIDEQLRIIKGGESLFIKLNYMLRKWCNFYCVGNTSNQLSKLNWLLWHRVYKYFYRLYRSKPQFRKSSTGVYARKLSAYIWKNHLKKHMGSNKWWSIYRGERKLSRARHEDLFLFMPRKTKILTPEVLLRRPEETGSLSAYYPEDRRLLAQKAIQWKSTLSSAIFVRAHRKCQCCQSMTGIL